VRLFGEVGRDALGSRRVEEARLGEEVEEEADADAEAEAEVEVEEEERWGEAPGSVTLSHEFAMLVAPGLGMEVGVGREWRELERERVGTEFDLLADSAAISGLALLCNGE
jgi:hypothetical protein